MTTSIDSMPLELEALRHRFGDADATLRMSGERDHQVRELVARAWQRIPFYQRIWKREGFAPTDFAGVADLSRVPLISTEDLRESIRLTPPFGDLVDPVLAQNVDMILTSGASGGSPRPVLVSPSDRRIAARVGARKWLLGGLKPGEDRVQVTATFSLHGSAWGGAWSLEEYGVTLLPTSAGTATPSHQQIEIARRAGATALMTSPSYARYLGGLMESTGRSPRELDIHTLFISGESASPAKRRELEDLFGATVLEGFGTMDTLLWSSVECRHSRLEGSAHAMHLWDDALIVEVLDENGLPCPDGEIGELVVTSWMPSAMPKIRLRMGDEVRIEPGHCSCGLRTRRISPVLGRRDQRLRIKGKNLWPDDIEAVARACFPGFGEYVLLVEDSADSGVTLLVETEAAETPAASVVTEAIAAAIRDKLGAHMNVVAAPPGGTAAMTGLGAHLKVRRVVRRTAAMVSGGTRG